MSAPISIREYARRMGVHHAAVQKRIKAGTLSRLPGGGLAPETATREWTANRYQSKVRKESVPSKNPGVRWNGSGCGSANIHPTGPSNQRLWDSRTQIERRHTADDAAVR